jgi:hypothetical protein
MRGKQEMVPVQDGEYVSPFLFRQRCSDESRDQAGT